MESTGGYVASKPAALDNDVNVYPDTNIATLPQTPIAPNITNINMASTSTTKCDHVVLGIPKNIFVKSVKNQANEW
ncbi:Hypothetical predicted protein [Paramuricea clavata]|uniref:Uncharacterized protein n=1 Tax=Paramuricea clavata TaxID=317549 RepID=A0A7D9D609_PARCT|nr:Hypothetical predicted protein [Paramuricea clavata]